MTDAQNQQAPATADPCVQPTRALALAFQAGIDHAAPHVFEVDGAPVAVVKDRDKEVTVLDERLFRDRPQHLKQQHALVKVADAIAYANRYKNAHSLIILSPEPQPGKAIARIILDYHTPEEAGARFKDHSVDVIFRTSWQFDLLTKLASGQFAQPDFALAIRDLAPYVASMESADLLELVRSLQLTSKGDHKTQEDEFSGSIDFVYNVQVKASAGTSERRVSVPQQIQWNLPVLLGGAKHAITTDFTYAVPANAAEKIKMGLRLNQQKELLQSLSDDVRDQLVKGTGLLAITAAL